MSSLVVFLIFTPVCQRTAYYDKLNHYAYQTLTNIFVYADAEYIYGGLLRLSDFLQDVLRFVISQPEYKHDTPHAEYYVKEILANKGTSDHVDILIKNWLAAEEAIFRRIGAYALGRIRISRAVPYLIEMLDNKSEDIDVLQEVS
jgi:hypothetical protein